MTIFFNLLNSEAKDEGLRAAVAGHHRLSYEVEHSQFELIPGCPFAYWLTEELRLKYVELQPFESNDRSAKQGLATTDDFRFLRAWWEVRVERTGDRAWAQFARSGGAARYYGESPLAINWFECGAELKALIAQRYGNAGKRIYNEASYFSAGFCWPLRGSRLSVKSVGPDSVFGIASKMAFVPVNQRGAYLAILNSSAFDALLRIQAGSSAGIQYESGLLSRVPVPSLSGETGDALAKLSRRIWKLIRSLDSRNETSHAFVMPALLMLERAESTAKWLKFLESVNSEVRACETEIDQLVFEAYGLDATDQRALAEAPRPSQVFDAEDDIEADSSEEDAQTADDENTVDYLQWELLSWSLGVAFGRFDWRIATGERAAPPEPEPFDPLPVRSPGMLPDGDVPFHAHAGILVDDQGHPHDLAPLIEEVLARVEAPVPEDVRRWLQRDFFAFHLQRYSKSRRKAPIYWPLSTASGSYTLWVYCPSVNSQTLFTAVNDFLDGPSGKLTQVSRECAELRIKGGGRSRDEEKQYEALQTFEQELTDLRDTLLKIAPTYQPNHDDGVQVTAAPLWPLFRHKPWQKVLKDTWTKLEKGDYDWAHLAMAYWPERVREKCKTDKSLAIAHGLDELYVEPEAAPKKTRGRKKAGSEK